MIHWAWIVVAVWFAGGIGFAIGYLSGQLSTIIE